MSVVTFEYAMPMLGSLFLPRYYVHSQGRLPPARSWCLSDSFGFPAAQLPIKVLNWKRWNGTLLLPIKNKAILQQISLALTDSINFAFK